MTPTFNWFDLETRSRPDANVVKVGLYKHAADPETHILGGWWRLGEDYWSEYRGYFADGITAAEADDARFDTKVLDAIENGELFAGHNVAYDRVIWNAHARRHNLPQLRIEQTVCTAAWAAAFNLPRSLGGLSRFLLPPQQAKLVDVAGEVKYMWDLDNPLVRPADMDKQMEYCKRDVEAMIDCAALLPDFDPAWLAQYHASEHVNDRGIRVDMDLAHAIADMEPAIQGRIAATMERIAGEEIKTRGPSLLKYLERTLPEDLQEALVVAEKYRDLATMGFRTKKRKSAGKAARRQLLAKIAESETDLPDVRRLLDAFEEANRAAVGKYKAAATRTNADDFLRGQFVFNGAGQTGRFSSHGVQVHNLKRTVHDDAEALIKLFIKAKGDPQYVRQRIGLDANEAASEILRPMFMAADSRWLAWSDWSSIEARMLPWLSGDKRARKVLDVFARGEDIYKVEASGIYGTPVEEIDKDMRQVGKVAILSLGYGGGVGAFQAMAAGYNVEVSAQQADTIKTAWRAANPWAPVFWQKLEAAAMTAIARPGKMIPAGRVQYQFLRGLARGTLICWLPSGRWLAYPEAKVQDVEKFDGEVVEPGIVFRHPNYGPSTTYGGALAENVTQAEAATLLREALVRCEADGLEVVSHVHDEIVIETDDPLVDGARLQKIMEAVPAWAEGLPLAAEAEYGRRYKILEGEI